MATAVEIIEATELPFGESAGAVEKFFIKKGWHLIEKSDIHLTFGFPNPIPEDLKELPVMGEEHFDSDKDNEPYIIQTWLNPEQIAVVMVVRRIDTSDRIDKFFEEIKTKYQISEFEKTETSETSSAGNQMIDTKSISENDDRIMLILRSKIRPTEEKLKNGMNDEIEIRIYPKKWNQGITVESLIDANTSQSLHD
ncbi:MAG: hypothetical protein H3C43_09265 [Leptonema sp. (in: Bacteria)]|nr:hypothetical protein [Leptonema sp. (in: bacteria)]